MKNLRHVILSLLAVLFTSVTVSYGADAKFDWKALEEEAVSTLSRYIQIDTTNPPGNELKAATFLKTILDKEGINTTAFLEPLPCSRA